MLGCRAGLSEPRRQVWAPVLPVPTTGVLSGTLCPHLWGWREIGLGSNNILGTFLPGWYMFIQQMSPGHQLGAGVMVVSKTDHPCPQRIKVRKKQVKLPSGYGHPMPWGLAPPSKSRPPLPIPLTQSSTITSGPDPYT